MKWPLFFNPRTRYEHKTVSLNSYEVDSWRRIIDPTPKNIGGDLEDDDGWHVVGTFPCFDNPPSRHTQTYFLLERVIP